MIDSPFAAQHARQLQVDTVAATSRYNYIVTTCRVSVIAYQAWWCFAVLQASVIAYHARRTTTTRALPATHISAASHVTQRVLDHLKQYRVLQCAFVILQLPSSHRLTLPHKPVCQAREATSRLVVTCKLLLL